MMNLNLPISLIKEIDLTISQYCGLDNKIENIIRKYPNLSIRYYTGELATKPPHICQINKVSLSIDPNGIIFPCTNHLYNRTYQLGNVKERNFDTDFKKTIISSCNANCFRFHLQDKKIHE